MFQRDYLLRMIEAAAAAVARALGLLLKKKPEEAQQAVDEGYAALSIDRELLLLLDGHTLRSQLADDVKLAMAVRLLTCDAEVQLHKGAPSAAARRLKAARKLLAVHPSAPAEVTSELERVAALLEASEKA